VLQNTNIVDNWRVETWRKCQNGARVIQQEVPKSYSEQEVSHIPEVWERKPEDKSFGKIMLPEEQ